ncbi:hypothetical protein NDU88_008716 [Pleurodeles waltl]|uniref:Uncharacterized protein n=1 Tax=Pleurodeles waltl TaxID=8319 RepID=A0AAV7N9X8_PLEWA|nr:hypothetical protein NDU88_008716 [Pleurodeles waltl]
MPLAKSPRARGQTVRGGRGSPWPRAPDQGVRLSVGAEDAPGQEPQIKGSDCPWGPRMPLAKSPRARGQTVRGGRGSPSLRAPEQGVGLSVGGEEAPGQEPQIKGSDCPWGPRMPLAKSPRSRGQTVRGGRGCPWPRAPEQGVRLSGGRGKPGQEPQSKGSDCP